MVFVACFDTSFQPMPPKSKLQGMLAQSRPGPLGTRVLGHPSRHNRVDSRRMDPRCVSGGFQVGSIVERRVYWTTSHVLPHKMRQYLLSETLEWVQGGV